MKFKLLIITLILFLLGACKKEETVLRIPFTNMPETFDRLLRSEYFTNIVNDNIYERLVSFEYSKPKPGLAEYWYNPNDSLVIVKLKENIRFSNGKLFTSTDAKASLERAINHPRSFFSNFAQVDSIQIRNKFQIEIYHKKSPFIVSLLSFAPMYCSDLISNPDDYIALNPLGTGEYYLFHSDKEKIILKKNKFNQNIKKNKKSPDVVEIYHEPSIETQFKMLKNGQADFVMNIPAKDYLDAIKDKRINLIEQISNIVMYMMLDAMSDNTPEIWLKDGNRPNKNPLKDLRVRQAIAHSLNTDMFIKDVMFNKAKILSVPFKVNMRYYPVNLSYYEYKPEYSGTLLRQAGYENGFIMRLRAISGKYSGDTELAVFIKKSLENIGIIVDIDYYPSEEFYNSLAEKPSSAFVTGFTSASRSIENSVRNLFLVEDGFIGSQNRMNLRVDGLSELTLQAVRMSDYDLNKKKITAEINKLIYDAKMIIPFYQPYDIMALSSRFEWIKSSDFIIFSDFRVKR